jgi:putative AdoMet-dependent methyltransferase
MKPEGILKCSLTLFFEDTDALVRSFAEHLKPGARVAPADLDAEDGTFHPADTQGVYHDVFDRGEFQAILESNVFKDVNFVTAHTVNKEGKTYPIFLVTAARG